MKDPLHAVLQQTESVRLFSRLGAYLFDVILINLAVMYPFNSFLSTYDSVLSFDLSLFFIFFFIIVLTLIYWLVCDYYFSQTIGKMIFGLRVLSKGKRLSFQQVFLRNITKPFSFLLLLDSWKLFLRGARQRYTEEVSKTWVESV